MTREEISCSGVRDGPLLFYLMPGCRQLVPQRRLECHGSHGRVHPLLQQGADAVPDVWTRRVQTPACPGHARNETPGSAALNHVDRRPAHDILERFHKLDDKPERETRRLGIDSGADSELRALARRKGHPAHSPIALLPVYTAAPPVSVSWTGNGLFVTISSIMTNATRVEVRRGKNESAASLIRRFSRRAQGLNLVRGMRASRYYARVKSKNVQHQRALVRSERINEYNEQVKLGKIDPAARRGRK